MAAIPLRVRAAEEALERGGVGALEEAQAELRRVLKPIGDHRGSAAYRLAMAQSLLAKAAYEVWTAFRMRARAAHVTGEALYTDDIAERYSGNSACLAGAVRRMLMPGDSARCDGAMAEPGVVTTLTAADVPGVGDSGANRHDEPLFPDEVTYHSQPVAWVLGETLEAARLGARA